MFEGTVRDESGHAVTGARVRVFAVRLRSEVLLAEVETDDAGRFALDLGKRADSLRSVRVVATAEDGAPAVSRVVPPEQRGADTDLVLPWRAADLSEFERVILAVQPAVRAEGIELEEVRGRDIDLLAADLGLPQDQVADLVTASTRMWSRTPKGLPRLRTEVWYAWLRAGLDLDEGLWTRPAADLAGIVERAVDDGVLPEGLRGDLGEIGARVRTWQLDRLLDAAAASSGDSLRLLLDTLPAPLSAPQRGVVAAVVLEERPLAADLAARLTAEGLSAEQAAGVVRTVRLADLTGGNARVVKALQARAGEGDDSTLAPLASLAPADWLDLSYQHAPGADADRAAARMQQAVEGLHPTATLTARLTDGTLVLSIAGGDDVGTFLTGDPSFDVLESPLAAAHPGVRGALTTLRRLHAVAPGWNEVAALLDANLHSPFDITGKEVGNMVALLRDHIPDQVARAIHHEALQLEGHIVAAGGAVVDLLDADIKIVPAGAAGPADIVDRHPTLRGLFGSLDGCSCPHCRSVLSPAAYYVDLLEFVRRQSPTGWSVLTERRPDLLELELSCDNTEREIPAIDLTLEILENAIALPLEVTLAAGEQLTEGAVVPGSVIGALRRTVRDVGPVLAQKESAALRPGVTAWTVSDRSHRWTLQQSRLALHVSDTRRDDTAQQPSLTAEEIGAAVDRLAAGGVSEALDDALRAFLSPDAAVRPALTVQGVETVDSGRVWRVTYLVDVTVRRGAGDVLTLEATTDGTVIRRGHYSTAAADATEEALDAGAAGGMLLALLPSARAYDAVPAPGRPAHRLRRRRVLKVEHTPASLRLQSLTHQASRPGQDLVAAPHNRNDEAYRRLRTASFPWSLPFDLALEETRALLDRAGVTRRQLMELWVGDGVPTNALDREVLGLSAEDWRIASSEVRGAAGLLAAWGMPETGMDELSRVSTILRQSGLSSAELGQHLQSRYVCPAGEPALPPGCRPSEMRLDPVDEAFLDRLHRFTRLRRRLGWSPRQLDVAVAAAGGLTQGSLRVLADLARIGTALDLDVERPATWWALSDPAPMDLRLDGTAPLDEHLTTLSREIGTNPSELALLAGALPLRPASATSPVETRPLKLTLDTVGRLRRAAELARALGLGAADFARAVRVSGIEPFPVEPVDHTGMDPRPGDTLAFCESVAAIRSSGFIFAELGHVLAPAGTGDIPGLGDDRIAALLADVRAAMHGVRTETATRDDETQLRDGLARMGWYPQLVDDVVADLTGPITAPAADVRRRLRWATLPVLTADTEALPAGWVAPEPLGQRLHAEPRGGGTRLVVAGWVEDGDAEALRAALGTAHDTAVDALRAATETAGSPGPRQRLLTETEIDTVLDAATGATRRAAMVRAGTLRRAESSVAVTELGRALKLTPADAETLLVDLLTVPGGTAPALSLLLDPAFAAVDPRAAVDPATLTDLVALVRGLHRLALLASRADLDAIQLPVCFDLNAALSTDGIPFAAFLRVLGLARLRTRRPGGATVADAYARDALLPGFDVAEAADLLASGLGLPAAEIASAGTGLDVRNPRDLVRLLDRVTALQRLGVSAGSVALLVADSPWEGARLAGTVLRSRYSTDSWSDVIQPVADDLRRRGRDALVDLLLHRDGAGGPDELYARYLMDVRAAPALLTSRLVHATAAVQLFVNRCLRGLEAQVPASVINRGRWDWMHRYRLWQANREVFLWPQNVLFPDLREDASPAFRRLQAALEETEPGVDPAHAALVEYLESLVELSTLDVIGLYAERTTADPNDSVDLHVVARTPHPPHRYYWRRGEDFGAAGMRWTPWEHIDLDVDGTQVLPVAIGGRPYIAWPVFRKDESTAPGVWEVKLAWARRTGSGWGERQLSRTGVRQPALVNLDERRTFWFSASETTVHHPTGVPVPAGLGEILDEPGTQITMYAALEVDAATRPVPLADVATSVAGALPRESASLDFTCQVLWSDDSGALWLADGAEVELCFTGAGLPGTPVTFSLTIGKSESGHRRFDPWPPLKTDFDPEKDIDPRIYAAVAWDMQVKVWYTDTGQPKKQLLAQRPFPHTAETLHLVKQWFVQFILPAPPGVTVPEAVGGAERHLFMRQRGGFTISASRGAEWRPDARDAELTVPESHRYDNGFREVLGRTTNTVRGVSPVKQPPLEQPLFQHSLGRFLLLPAGGQPTRYWYYRDAAARYYLRRRADGTTLVITDGHPGAGRFHIKGLRGLDDLYTAAEQRLSDAGGVLRANYPGVESKVVGHLSQQDGGAPSLPWQGVHFDGRSPYAGYHWELFLHLPVLFAEQLARQQRYDEAERWLRLVLDPTSEEARAQTTPDPRAYWRFQPFRDAGRPHRIEDLVEWLADPNRTSMAEREFANHVERWQETPFRPHAIAQLRPSAYQWDVVFSYLDMLLAAGDDLFRRDTRESVADATSYYLGAAEILGPRPNVMTAEDDRPLTYRSAAGHWDKFANTWFTLADSRWARMRSRRAPSDRPLPAVPHPGVASLTGLGRPYFCVPPNPRIDEYRARVEERLDNIRHSRNIEGVERQLALFAPRIDPELLVRAVAAGLDIGQVLAEGARPLPTYRFRTLVQNATELCGQVQTLGTSVLSALEKQDAEQIAVLRSGHEVSMLETVTEIRRDQVRDARANCDALTASRELVASRYEHYQHLITGRRAEAPGPGARVTEESTRLEFAGTDDPAGLVLIQTERSHLQRNTESSWFGLASGGAHTASSIAHTLSIMEIPPSPPFWEKFGRAGTGLGHALDTASKWAANHASRDATIAGYQRRRAEWIHAGNAALRELAQIDRQAIVAEIRLVIAEQELANHEKHVERATDTAEFLRDKYTNQELYGWMSGQLGSVYFAAYQLASDVARQAERAFRSELHEPTAQFIRPPVWDGLHKGLLAGERLAQDLQRLEVAYLERNRRELELTRIFSLRDTDPKALLELRETGSCDFELSELLFEVDVPGLYLRRLKSVGLTLPCVVSEHTALHCRLTLRSSRLRTRKDAGDGALIDDHALAETVLTSGAVEATGMFQANLNDEQLLPFEGRGAISRWRLELPGEYRQFDYASITDARLTVRYTARDGGRALREAAIKHLDSATSGASGEPLALLVSLRHEFPSEWTRLTAREGGNGTVEVTIGRDRFPFMFGRRKIVVSAAEAIPVLGQEDNDTVPPKVPVTPAGDVKVDSANGARWTVTVPDDVRTRLRELHLILSYRADKL